MIVTVFRSRLKDDCRDEYMELGARMRAIGGSMPGFVSHKVFVAEDGERVAIVEFEDEASQQAWSRHAGHVAAKQRGRAAFYTEYRMQICTVVREASFVASDL